MLLLGKPLDFSLRFGQAFARGCRVVAVDVEPTAPDDRVTLSLAADPAGVAGAAGRSTPPLRRWPRSGVARAGRERAAGEPARVGASGAAPRAAPIHPLRVCAALAPHVEAGAVLVCDGGEFGQWVQAGLEPRERLINGLERLDRQRAADGGGRPRWPVPTGRCWP